MEKRLYFITGKDKFWGQFRKPWHTLDIGIFEQELKAAGWDVITCEFHEVTNGLVKIKNSIVFYSFSQKESLREYYKDTVFFLKMMGNIVVPSYEFLLCHENKGFQELFKKQMGLEDLWSLYLTDVSEIAHYDIPYPVVLKTLDGSNGKGVFLVKDEKSLKQKILDITKTYSLPERIDLLRRRFFRFKKQVKGWPEYNRLDDYYRYAEYIKPTRSYILQEYIPDLEHDFRVLFVYDHFYVTKRHVRKNDFRASGSKLFDFDTGDVQKLLDYAANIAKLSALPYISLDIVMQKNKFRLLEYQASHFGTNVIKLSKGYYVKGTDNWDFIEAKPQVSRVLAKGLLRYLENLAD